MPSDLRSSSWNLFNECKESRDVEIIAEALIPNRGFSDPFWSDASKTLFSAVVGKLINTSEANHVDLFKHLALSKLKDLEAFLENTEAAQLISAKNDKTSLSVRATMTPYIKFLKYIDSPADNKQIFSIKNWIQSDKPGGSILFLACKGDQRSIYVPLISAWMNLALNSLMGREFNQEHKLWFIMDELSSLQNLPALAPLLAEGRKYGACCLIGTQTINQILDTYQVYKGKTLLSLFNTKLFFKCSEPDTQAWIARCLGEYEEEEYIENITYGAHRMRDGISLSNSIKTKPMILPSELSSLRIGEAFVKLPSGTVSKVFTKEFKDKNNL
jgi:type IV secretory pathway TraG/TraD family ATPase VirD4